jgi:hypothetical protein
MGGKGGREVYISVDVEADGPVPGRYSLVSLGACVAAVLAAAGRVEIIGASAARVCGNDA